jgi:hypothetical protein
MVDAASVLTRPVGHEFDFESVGVLQVGGVVVGAAGVILLPRSDHRGEVVSRKERRIA